MKRQHEKASDAASLRMERKTQIHQLQFMGKGENPFSASVLPCFPQLVLPTHCGVQHS